MGQVLCILLCVKGGVDLLNQRRIGQGLGQSWVTLNLHPCGCVGRFRLDGLGAALARLECAIAGEIAEQDFPLLLVLGPDESQAEEKTPKCIFVIVGVLIPGK